MRSRPAGAARARAAAAAAARADRTLAEALGDA